MTSLDCGRMVLTDVEGKIFYLLLAVRAIYLVSNQRRMVRSFVENRQMYLCYLPQCEARNHSAATLLRPYCHMATFPAIALQD